jgi:hypothetical protein
MFFRSREQPFLARGFRVNQPQDIAKSPLLGALQKQYGALEENRFYTFASDTLAASTEARYLEDRGSPATVLDSPSAGLEILWSCDAILFVGSGTSVQVPEILDRLRYGYQRSESGTNRGLLDRRKLSAQSWRGIPGSGTLSHPVHRPRSACPSSRQGPGYARPVGGIFLQSRARLGADNSG